MKFGQEMDGWQKKPAGTCNPCVGHHNPSLCTCYDVLINIHPRKDCIRAPSAHPCLVYFPPPRSCLWGTASQERTGCSRLWRGHCTQDPQPSQQVLLHTSCVTSDRSLHLSERKLSRLSNEVFGLESSKSPSFGAHL